VATRINDAIVSTTMRYLCESRKRPGRNFCRTGK